MSETATVEATAETAPDTAAPIPDTAAPEAEAPVGTETEALIGETETETPESTETEAPESDPDPVLDDDPAPVPTLADLSDDDLIRDERISKLIEDRASRQAESDRLRSENEAKRREMQRREEAFRTGTIAQDLRAVLQSSLTEGEDGQPQLELDSGKVTRLTNELWETASQATFSALDALLGDQYPDGYRLSPDDASRLQRVRDDVYAGRKSLEDLIGERIAHVREAHLDAMREQIRSEERKAARKEFEQREKNQSVKAADTKRAEAPGPSRVDGTPATGNASAAEIISRYARGDSDISDEMYTTAMREVGAI